MQKQLTKGNVAIVKAAVLAGCRAFYGYRPAFYASMGCTGCGICFFVCPEPGGIRVFRLDAVAAA